MRTIVAFRRMTAIVFAAVAASAFAQGVARTHVVAEVAEVSVPAGWQVASREQVVQFEKSRDKTLADANLKPKIEAAKVTTFQATKASAGAFVGLTVMPGEVSQSRLVLYPPEQVKYVGDQLIERHHKALAASGCTDITFSAPSLKRVGDKTGVGFSLAYTAPDGARYVGTKNHVYMSNATVVVSTAWPASAAAPVLKEAASAVATLKLSEQ